jgi:hypothetical protein
VELYFAAWLLDHNYKFAFPTVGADILVELEREELPIEVTALRHSTWLRLLLEKLDVIAALSGFKGKMKYTRYTPDLLTETAYRSILSSVQSAMLAAEGAGGRSQIVQRFEDLGCTIMWKRSADAYFGASSSDLSPASQFGAKLIFGAVQKKARQLPQDRPGCVLLEVGDDERHHVHAFASRLGGEEGLLRWERIDPRIKYVILYWTSFDRIGPWSWMRLENPFSPIPEPRGFDEFWQAVFPQEVPIGGVDMSWVDRAVEEILEEIAVDPG